MNREKEVQKVIFKESSPRTRAFRLKKIDHTTAWEQERIAEEVSNDEPEKGGPKNQGG